MKSGGTKEKTVGGERLLELTAGTVPGGAMRTPAAERSRSSRMVAVRADWHIVYSKLPIYLSIPNEFLSFRT